MNVAVVGLGAMGTRVAMRLLGAGHEVHVWNRSPHKAQPLVDRGAVAVSSPAEAAACSEALVTMVADSVALRAVTSGAEGIAAGADPSLIVVEMSTVGPEATLELDAKLPAGVGLIDAPVLGSIAEAESGSLTVLVGGPKMLVDRVRPLLDPLGRMVHLGSLGSGAAAKLVANAALFGEVALLGETILLGRRLGLADAGIFETLADTPLAAQAERRRPMIVSGEYPRRFALSLARKDAQLIRDAAETSGARVQLIEAAGRWLAQGDDSGWGNHDYTAMLAFILGDSISAGCE